MKAKKKKDTKHNNNVWAKRRWRCWSQEVRQIQIQTQIQIHKCQTKPNLTKSFGPKPKQPEEKPARELNQASRAEQSPWQKQWQRQRQSSKFCLPRRGCMCVRLCLSSVHVFVCVHPSHRIFFCQLCVNSMPSLSLCFYSLKDATKKDLKLFTVARCCSLFAILIHTHVHTIVHKYIYAYICTFNLQLSKAAAAAAAAARYTHKTKLSNQ